MLQYSQCEPQSFYSRPTSSFIPTYPPLDESSSLSSSYGAATQSTISDEYGPPTEIVAPVIHKHVYIHIAPPEPDYNTEYPVKSQPKQAIQKHYRIIFIKAPTQKAPTVSLPSIQPLSEEKTIVYVLVRKPEELPEIIMPTPSTTIPSKPEVYFIRYKTTEEKTTTETNQGGFYNK